MLSFSLGLVVLTFWSYVEKFKKTATGQILEKSATGLGAFWCRATVPAKMVLLRNYFVLGL